MINRAKGIRAAKEYLYDKAMEKTLQYQIKQLQDSWHSLMRLVMLKLEKLLNFILKIWN